MSDDLAKPNRLGITSAAELHVAEGRLTSIRIRELQEQPIQGAFDAKHLQAIHEYIFQDVYDHAGRFRTDTGVRFKDRTLDTLGESHRVYYPPSSIMNRYLESTLADAGGAARFAPLNQRDFSKRMTELYASLDYLHPFEDGNSRTLRTFTAQLARAAGRDLDWAKDANDNTRDVLYAARDKEVLGRIRPLMPTDELEAGVAASIKSLSKYPDLESFISQRVPLLKTQVQEMPAGLSAPRPKHNDMER